jgi:hypothetical protein
MKRILLFLFLSLLAYDMTLTAQRKTLLPAEEFPGAPENAPAAVITGDDNKKLVLEYNGSALFECRFSRPVTVTPEVQGEEIIDQHIMIAFDTVTTFHATVYGSSEAFAAETRGTAQERFPLVRTSHGLSNNLRNNAVYDRRLDWMLEMPEGTVIHSFRNPDGTTRFELTITAQKAALVFRPRYYQKHKNLPYFQPWSYTVYKESVTGWSSWWAYFRGFTEKDLQALLDIWQKKHFADYGYRFIQIDDGYQGENDKGRQNSSKANGYLGGRPTTWLDWKKDLFPGGLNGYVTSVKGAGFDPAVWMGCFFSDEATVQQHPGWFVTDASGRPVAAPWVSYAMDATSEEVARALIRPVFKGLKDAGVDYVKIDQLRHYLYDNLHNHLEWCREKGVTPAEVMRAYLTIAREELGDETFILSCWGVLPESIGIADACRIGGDGYGPVTMQQYNSWNGVVWRNDPDHCDVLPVKKAAEKGNVKKTEKVKAVPKESILRPALASIAGAMLMLSDKPEIYADDNNLYGLRRASPVLFSVPGQLYDYDPSKTDWLKEHERTEIRSGRSPTPVDGDQFGEVSAFWLNEFNTFFGHWYVLHRLNWPEKNKKEMDLPPVTIRFADLGLDPAKEYLVYEFWGDRMLGVHKKMFRLERLEPYGIESLAIREKLGRPQLLSTNRHLSQGAAEIEKLLWEDHTLRGRSRVITEDRYVITVYVPQGYRFKSAKADGQEVVTEEKDQILKVSWLPQQTASVAWEIAFEKR